MALHWVLLTVVLASAQGQQPGGVTDPLYKCTFQERVERTTDLALYVSVEGTPVACGNTTNFEASHITSTPSVRLNGTRPDGLYALLLLNPDWLIPFFIRPILHHAVFNIKGSDLESGKLTAGDTLVPFFRPHPPLPRWTFHYVYLAFEQKDVVHFEKDFVTKAFPVEKVMAQKDLTLVQTNFFTAQLSLASVNSTNDTIV